MNLSDFHLEWVHNLPLVCNRVALLIPQYNEGMNCNMEKRLYYFKELAQEYKHIVDVILIDDGSTDNSLSVMQEFVANHSDSFYLTAVTPNAQKVGALYAVANNLPHEFVILSDFDTDLMCLQNLEQSLSQLDEDPDMMGAYFKMIPYEGSGLCFQLQQMEYSFARIYYKFHDKDKSVPVMPGAGSCFKRDMLIELYHEHSGLRNGEDRETTVLGMEKGYKTMYADKVLALTRPPLTFKVLANQRKRWYAGYLETVLKENKFYVSKILRFHRIGIRTLQDLLGVLVLLLLPLELIILSIVSLKLTASLVVGAYLLSILYYFTLFAANKYERTEIRKGSTWLILLYPLFWLSISFLAWWRAIGVVHKSKILEIMKKKRKKVTLRTVYKKISQQL
ncbi:glycosyltransferase family 2 protein [Chitinophaga sp. LS1]|uniref:glycosyltransferase n=1 Tax=Chitinophaga sp. LS1 TaxID=3051176 RepID=UPI002AAA70C9|nr:glycosyltransferase family 2 protein [Chitinophaga sp. LS1]WPV66523.1 glycosyltransferase family 2 protein [Chitinophaga sp. LS1]